MREIRIVNLTSSISRAAGGLFESVRHLAQQTHLPGRCRVLAVGLEDAHAAEDLSRWRPVEVSPCRILGPQKFGYSPEMAAALGRLEADLLHLHGIWKYPSMAAVQWSRRTRRPYIVSAHGMLEPWALAQSKWLKRLATKLYQGQCLRHASCLRATSRLEYDSIRQAGYSNPVAVVPNGVELPRELPALRKSRVSGTKRRALFLSRLHPKKGLLNLVTAWTNLRPKDWELLIVGPEEGGHSAELQAKVAAAGMQRDILFPGEAWGDARTRLYAGSDLFVLPSFSENFGLVIAEALSCEVPVITTRATPWQELQDLRCGWWIETGADPLVRALREALSLPSHTLREMGRRGRQLIKSKYTWEPIGRQMLEVYEWMLGRREPPPCVQT
jgi:glycosyltransferase involved in cell wall biosynthesis